MRLGQEGFNRARVQLVEKHGPAYHQPYNHAKISMAAEAATCENALDTDGNSCGLPPMRCVCLSALAVSECGAALCIVGELGAHVCATAWYLRTTFLSI
jgi:hypothetical protein